MSGVGENRFSTLVHCILHTLASTVAIKVGTKRRVGHLLPSGSHNGLFPRCLPARHDGTLSRVSASNMLSVTKRSRRAAEAAATAAAAPPDSRSILVALNEDALVRVLFAAKKAGVLEALASSSKPLSFLARSRVPLELRVSNHAEAGLVLNCQQDVGGPFSGCRLLHLQTMDPGFSTICKGVLKAARKWTALRTLQLDIRLAPWRWQDTTPLDEAAAGALCKLSTLQQLRCLELS